MAHHKHKDTEPVRKHEKRTFSGEDTRLPRVINPAESRKKNEIDWLKEHDMKLNHREKKYLERHREQKHEKETKVRSKAERPHGVKSTKLQAGHKYGRIAEIPALDKAGKRAREQWEKPTPETKYHETKHEKRARKETARLAHDGVPVAPLQNTAGYFLERGISRGQPTPPVEKAGANFLQRLLGSNLDEYLGGLFPQQYQGNQPQQQYQPMPQQQYQRISPQSSELQEYPEGYQSNPQRMPLLERDPDLEVSRSGRMFRSRMDFPTLAEYNQYRNQMGYPDSTPESEQRYQQTGFGDMMDTRAAIEAAQAYQNQPSQPTQQDLASERAALQRLPTADMARVSKAKRYAIDRGLRVPTIAEILGQQPPQQTQLAEQLDPNGAQAQQRRWAAELKDILGPNGKLPPGDEGQLYPQAQVSPEQYQQNATQGMNHQQQYAYRQEEYPGGPGGGGGGWGGSPQGGGQGLYGNQLQGQLRSFEEPYMRQFLEQTGPQIAEQFAGHGGIRGSGFQNAIMGAARGLQGDLATTKANLVQQFMDRQLQAANIGLGYSQAQNQRYGLQQQDVNMALPYSQLPAQQWQQSLQAQNQAMGAAQYRGNVQNQMDANRRNEDFVKQQMILQHPSTNRIGIPALQKGAPSWLPIANAAINGVAVAAGSYFGGPAGGAAAGTAANALTNQTAGSPAGPLQTSNPNAMYPTYR